MNISAESSLRPVTARSLGGRHLRWALCSAALFSIAAPSAFAEDLKPLFQHDLSGIAGKSFTTAEVDFAPGTKADAHRHGDAFVYAYVLSGTIRSQLAGEPVKTFHAGQSWFEPPGARHLLTANASQKKAARLLVVFVSNSGDPLKTPDIAKDTMTNASAANLVLAASTTPAVGTPSGQQMVDALHTAFGDHHSRAVHAKGVMAEGTFQPAQDASTVSNASLFRDGTLPVLVRFSDFTGIPEIPDNIGDANPRGFAVKFKLPDGSSADVISHSFNGFPVSTSAEFRELLIAIGAAGAKQPASLDAFLASHPIAKTFLTTQKPPPESYTTLSYFGVNAFEVTDAKGKDHFIRYRFVPVKGEALLTPEQIATKGPDYLQTELPERLAKTPVAFAWYAQVADSPDVIGDPSVAWPESRRLVKLGVITIMRMTPDPVTTDRGTMFSPLNIPEAIRPADPMLGVRQSAYPISFQHRQ